MSLSDAELRSLARQANQHRENRQSVLLDLLPPMSQIRDMVLLVYGTIAQAARETGIDRTQLSSWLRESAPVPKHRVLEFCQFTYLLTNAAADICSKDDVT